MRYLVMVKYNENGTPPPQALLDAIAKNRQEARQAAGLVAVGGLLPSSSGASPTFRRESDPYRRTLYRDAGSLSAGTRCTRSRRSRR